MLTQQTFPISTLSQQILEENDSSLLEKLPPSTYSCLLVNLDHISHNIRFFQNISPFVTCMPIIKSECYGLKFDKILPLLYKNGAQDFFVASIDEAIKVRSLLNNDAHIYLLNGYFEKTEDVLNEYKITPVLTDLGRIQSWKDYHKHEKLPSALLHVNTGINRTGVPDSELEKIKQDPSLLQGIDWRLVMSHLACADRPYHPLNAKQKQRFQDLRKFLPLAPASLANTAGVALGEDYLFQVIRPGKGLYGINSLEQEFKLPILPSISYWTRIYQIQSIKAGENIGYGCHFTSKNNMRIATVSSGYADGIPISLTNQGDLYVNNIPCPIVGRVSMDLVTIDITHLSEDETFVGQWVKVFGGKHPIESVAKKAQTTSHDILLKLGPRVQRIYINNNDNDG